MGITVLATKYGGQETTVRAIHDMMLVHGMLVAGDGHVEHDAGHFGISASRPAEEDPYAAVRISVTAKRIV